MPRYRYTAVDPIGRSLTGEVEAPDSQRALRQLQAEGLQQVSVTSAGGGEEWISGNEATVITRQLASLSEAELPLISGLQAVLEDTTSPRLRRALQRCCRELEAGQPADVCLQKLGTQLPRHISLVLASGLPPVVIARLLDRKLLIGRRGNADRSRLLIALSYPAVVFLALGCTWLFVLVYVGGQFKKIFEDFGTELPSVTVFVLKISDWFRNFLVPIVAAGATGIVIGSLAVRLGMSRLQRRRMWCALPVIGPSARYSALSELAWHLAIFLESQVPLPQALRWAGACSRDVELEEYCEQLARAAERGDSLVRTVEGQDYYPAALQQIIRWIEDHPGRQEMLQRGAELFEQRARGEGQFLLPLLEPMALFLSAIGTGFLVFVLLLPLLKLLNDLS